MFQFMTDNRSVFREFKQLYLNESSDHGQKKLYFILQLMHLDMTWVLLCVAIYLAIHHFSNNL